MLQHGQPIFADRIFNREGSQTHIYHWMVPYFDAEGSISGVIDGWIDITDRKQLEEALRDRSFGAARMADTLCQQMLIDVNRDVLRSRTAQEERDSYRVDPKMEEVLRYILDHLGEELTVESLSKRFFISRYYLMHRFKAVTGYTVHQYISQKRLLRAGELIRAGVPVMKAAEQAGFPEYSTFLRA